MGYSLNNLNKIQIDNVYQRIKTFRLNHDGLPSIRMFGNIFVCPGSAAYLRHELLFAHAFLSSEPPETSSAACRINKKILPGFSRHKLAAGHRPTADLQ